MKSDRQIANRVLSQSGEMSQVSFSHDYRHVYVGTEEGWLLVLDAQNLATVMRLRWHLAAIRCLAVSPDGRTVATGGAEGIVKLWPLDHLLPSVS